MSTGVWRFLPLFLSPRPSRSGRRNVPFFAAFHALTVDDAGCRTGFTPHRLAALHMERVMDAIERALPGPQIEIIEQRAARRQALRHVAPLAACAQHVHLAVDEFTHIYCPLAPAPLGRWRQLRDMLTIQRR